MTRAGKPRRCGESRDIKLNIDIPPGINVTQGDLTVSEISIFNRYASLKTNFIILLLVLLTGLMQQVSAATDNNSLAVLDITERAYDGGNALAVTFSLPLDSRQDIDEYLRVSQLPNLPVDGSWVLSDNLKLAYFAHINPKTKYRVKVYPGLISAEGVRMQSRAEQIIETRNIVPSAVFASSGHFLPAKLSEGLVINSVNIPEVNIEYFRIKPEKTTQFLQFTRDKRGTSWYPYYLNQAVSYADLIYAARYQLQPKPNKRGNSTIALSDIKGIQTAGIYMAVMTVPAVYGNAKQLSYFTVTDLGIHARIYDDQLDVYSNSIASGNAIGKSTVSLLDANGQVLDSEPSTADGYVSFSNVHKTARYITARMDGNFSYIELQGPALDLSQFDIGKQNQRLAEIFIYGPRDLYRPGESIEFSAIRRNADGQQIVDIPLQVKILRPDRVAAHNFTWHPSANGYYQFKYDLPASAKPGNWTLQVSGIGKNETSYKFKVEEFLPERMEMEFNNASTTALFFDDQANLEIPVTGRYLYGAPASANRISARVVARQSDEIIPSLKGYRFGHEAGISAKAYSVTDFNLDKQGNGLIKLNSPWPATKSAFEVKVITSLYESGGRPINRVYSAFVWPEQSMIGINPDFGDQNPEQNSIPGFNIVKATQAGVIQSASDLEVRLIREDRNYFWEYNDDRGWHWQWTDKEFAVYSEVLNLDGKAPAHIKIPVEYGRYRLEILDRANNNQLSSVQFHAGKDWYYWWRQNNSNNGQAARPDQVNLAFDAESYQAGDVAKLRVVSPHAGQAIITVESNRLLWFKRSQIAADGSTIEIPIDENWKTHDIYVSVVVFKPGDSKNTISPNRAIGIRHLALDRSDRQLQLEIDAKDKILPDRLHHFKVKVSAEGEPGKRHVTLAAVDVGILAISRFDTPDPFEAFFGQRRYSVDQRDMYQKIIELEKSQTAKLRFGGDALLAKGGDAAKADVQIVSLFSGLVEIDENGVATVPMQIPDFNGRLRLMALAFGEDSYGSAEKEVTVAAAIVAQISMPRFLAFGDKATLALDLTNQSGRAQKLSIKLEASNPLILASNLDSYLQLENGERSSLRFTIDANRASGSGQIKLTVSDEDGQEFSKAWKLSVRSAYPSVTETVGRVVNQGGQIDIIDAVDLGDYQAGSLQALLAVSTEANLRLQEQLQHLIGYPYGCLEQATSKAYPLAFSTASNLEKLGITQYGNEKIQGFIDRGLQRLGSLQKSNGGFGLWDANSQEEQWLTVYSADFMLTARNNGFTVPDILLTKTLKRLQQYARQQGRFLQQRYSDDNRHYSIASKAYAAYLLSGLNQVTLGVLRTLYDKESQYALSPLPLLHLGFALIMQGDQKRGEAAVDRALAMSVEQRKGYYGDYGSNIRDLGVMIHLLVKHGVKQTTVSELGFKLASELRSRRWLSTQERSSLFVAGLALNHLPSKDWQIAIKTGNDSLVVDGEGSFSKLLNAQTIGDKLMLEATKGNGLYASISVSGYLNNPPEPEQNGLSIRRQYFDSNGEPLDFDNIKTGDLILVDLAISAKQRTPDALLIDLLPAGFELENQNLGRSVSLDSLSIQGNSIASLQEATQKQYEEFRDDRYVTALDLNGYGESHVVYLVRAVTPGRYAVPAPFIEDMYRPEIRAIGETVGTLTIRDKQ